MRVRPVLVGAARAMSLETHRLRGDGVEEVPRRPLVAPAK